MTFEPHKETLTTLNPVAVKLGQGEVYAPGHTEWGTVTCDLCGEKFSIGPDRIHGSRRGASGCVELLEASLSKDHIDKSPHRNSYEFPE